MKKNTIMIILVVALLTVFGVGHASATCSQYGKVFYIYCNDTGTTAYAYVYIAPRTTIPTYGYYFYTTENSVITAMSNAMNSGNTVHISGNRSSCVTTGTYRYGGTIQYFRQFRNY